MPRFDITSPDGRTIEVTAPEGATEEQAIQYAQANWASLLASQPQPKSGTGAAFRAGVENIKGDITGLAGRTGLMDVEEAARKQQAYKQKAAGIFKPTEEGWLDAPLTKLGELAGGSAPYMAAPVIAGGAAALAGAPAAVGTGLAGLASLGQFTATNLGRQVDEGKKLAETDIGSAALAAIPQAALDMVSFKMAPGLRTIFGAGGKQLAEKEAVAIAQQSLRKTAADYAAQTGKAMTAEGLTEAAQQVLERAQAGLSLNDDKAREEYWQSLVGGAVLGGALAPAGRFMERGKIAEVQAADAKAKATAEREAARAAEEKAAMGAPTPSTPPTQPSEMDVSPAPASAIPANEGYAPAQADMFSDMTAKPLEAEQVDPIQRKQELTTQIRTLQGALEDAQDVVAQSETPAASVAAAKRYQQINDALQRATAEHASITIEATPDEKLARAFSSWNKSKGAGDVEATAKHAQRIMELQAAGATTPTAMPMTQKAVPMRDFTGKSEGTDEFNQRVVGPEMAAGREQAAAQRVRTDNELAAQRRLGRETEPTFTGEARRDRATAVDIADMEKGRMDTSRTDQRTLFDDATVAPRFVDSAESYDRKRDALIQEIQKARREKDNDAASEAIFALRALNKQKRSVQANMGRSEASGTLQPMLGESVFTGPAREGQETAGVEARPARRETTGEDLRRQIVQLPENLDPETDAIVQRLSANLPAVAMNPARRESVSDWLHSVRIGQPKDAGQIVQQLDALEQGKRSATEQQTIPRQARTEPLSWTEPTGVTRTATQRPLLDGGTQTVENAPLSYMQPGPRKVTQVEAPRIFSSPEAFQKYLGSEALQRLRTMLGSATQTVQRAMKKIVPLQKRIDQLTDSIAAERDKYERTRQYTDVMLADADAKHEAAQARFDAVIQRLDAELVPLQAEYLSAKMELDDALKFTKQVMQVIEENRAVAGPAALRKMRPLQDKLQESLAEVEQLSVAFVNAKADLDRVAKNQQRRVTTKRDVGAAQAELTAAEQERTGVVAEGRAARTDSQAERERLRAERSGVQKQVEDIMRPVNEARDARIKKNEPATYEARRTVADTVSDQKREAASGVRTAEEQARLERMEAMPGERIDQSKYRAVRDAAPVDMLREERKDMLRAMWEDASLPQTTRDKAKRVLKAMEREDSTQEQRSSAQAELTRLVDERIPELRAKVAEAPTPANKQELGIARRAAEKLAALLQRVERAPVGKFTSDFRGPYKEQAAYTTPEPEPAVEPGVRSEITPSEQRTGSDESKGNVQRENAYTGQTETVTNKTGNDNKIKEQRNTAVGRKEQQQANDEAAALLKDMPNIDKSAEAWYAETTKAIRNQITTLETELEEANAKVADIQQRPTKFSPEDHTNADRLVRAIESELESAQTELDKREAAAREEDAPAQTLTGPNITTLNGTDWAGNFDGEYENLLYRTATQTGKGMETAAVTRLANRVVEGWTNVPPVPVVATEADLPARIQEQAARDKMTGRIPGLFDPDTGTVFLVAENLHTGNDVALTIAHEVAGHYGLRDMMGKDYSGTMKRLYDGNPAIKKAADARMKASPNLSQDVAVEESLAEMAETLDAREGIPAHLARAFYAIKSWLAKSLGIRGVSDGEVKQIVANARRHVKRGTGKGPGGGPKGSVYRGGSATADLAKDIISTPRGFKDRFGTNKALALEMAAVDMRAPLIKALSAADQKIAAQASYYVRKADARMSMTYAALSGGPLSMRTDSKGMRVIEAGNGPSARDIFKAVGQIPGENGEEKMRIAQVYLTAQRASRVGWDMLGFSTEYAGSLKDKATAMMAEVNADPEMKAALENVRSMYNEYNKGLIEFNVASGAMSKAVGKELLQDGDYVPFYRVRPDGTAELVLSEDRTIAIGNIRTQPYLQELKGSEQKLLPLNEAITRNTMLLTDMGLRNMATKDVAYALQSIGADAKKMHIRDGKGEASPNAVRLKQDGEDKHVVIDTAGTAIEGIPSDMVAQSMDGSFATLPAFLKLGGWFADVLRSGVTRSPMYIARQLLRDPMAASFTGGLESGPVMATFKSLSSYAQQMTRGDSETSKELMRKGVIQSGIFTGDVDDVSKFALQLAGGDQSAYHKFIAGWDRAAMKADSVTREQLYKDAIGKGMSEMEAELAAMEMMNFNKRGMSPSVQYAARMIPFFNAQIQGLNVLYKAFSGKMPMDEQLKIKQKFFNRALGLTAFTMLYAAAMEDDETYKNARARDRYNNFIVPNPLGGEHIKLPIPFEVGVLFKALPEAVMDAMRDKFGPNEWKAVRGLLVNQIPGASSYGIPQIAKPALEAAFNYNTLTGREIESAQQRKLAPQERFNNTTSEIAKILSSALAAQPVDAVKLSPVQIDHLVSGYLGAVPVMVARLTNSVFAGEADVTRPEGALTDSPVYGSLFQKRNGGAALDIAYAQSEAIAQASATYKKMIAEGRVEEAEKYRNEAIDVVIAPGPAAQFTQQMAKLSRYERQLRLSEKDPAELRRRLDLLDEKRAQISAAYSKAFARLER